MDNSYDIKLSAEWGVQAYLAQCGKSENWTPFQQINSLKHWMVSNK